MAGGGDADLILDSTLVAVRTIKTLTFGRAQFNQLIGYVCLAHLGGMGRGSPRPHPIDRIGVYFSRYDLLHILRWDQIAGIAALPVFVKCFAQRARSQFAPTATAGKLR